MKSQTKFRLTRKNVVKNLNFSRKMSIFGGFKIILSRDFNLNTFLMPNLAIPENWCPDEKKSLKILKAFF